MDASAVECRVRAARLLDAWVAGDRQQLAFELNDLATHGVEWDGRQEMLLSVVREMMKESDLYISRTEKPRLGVWLDLLAHLSNRDTLR